MKLTGKLKENVEKSGSDEEAKKLIAEAGFDLTDEELENVTGGWSVRPKQPGAVPSTKPIV